MDTNLSRSELHALDAMTLYATLSAVSDWKRGAEARRNGRDPSFEQPASVAMPEVRRLITEWREQLAGLEVAVLLSAIAAHPPDVLPPDIEDPEADTGYLVAHFHERMLVRQMTGQIHVLHQHLLSLYPNVSDHAIEKTRLLGQVAQALLEADPTDFAVYRDLFLSRAWPHWQVLSEWMADVA